LEDIMKRLLVLSLSVIFLMGWLGFSEAAMCEGCKAMGRHEMGHGMAGMGMSGEHGMPGMIASLGLNDTQREEIESIHFKCKREAIKKRAAVAVAEVDLREILGKEPVDMNAAEAKIKEIAGLKADLGILHIRSVEEIKTKLTPEQKKKFTSLLGMGQMAEMGMMGMGEGMMGMRSGMRGGMKDGMRGMRGFRQGKCGMRMGSGDTEGDGDGGDESQPSSGTEEPQ
jgi:Spy/CpxP family protein refolding chaperone